MTSQVTPTTVIRNIGTVIGAVLSGFSWLIAGLIAIVFVGNIVATILGDAKEKAEMLNLTRATYTNALSLSAENEVLKSKVDSLQSQINDIKRGLRIP